MPFERFARLMIAVILRVILLLMLALLPLLYSNSDLIQLFKGLTFSLAALASNQCSLSTVYSPYISLLQDSMKLNAIVQISKDHF